MRSGIPSDECSFRRYSKPFFREDSFHIETRIMTSSTFNAQSSSSQDAQEEFKDLGFGAEVARGTRQRLLNRDGTFNVVRGGLNPLSSLSLYHWLLRISWPQFLA